MPSAGSPATLPAAVALIAVAGLVAVVASAPAVQADPAVWVRSNFESSFGYKVSRDCGMSEPIPGADGENLWVFCDTGVFDTAGTMVRYFAGSSAARGPTKAGATPSGLSELPSPSQPLPALPWSGAPEQFVPAPTGLVRADGSACVRSGTPGAAASWISGIVRLPDTSRLLLTYVDVCIAKTWEWVAQSFGTVEYDPGSHTLSNRTTLFAERSGRELADPFHFGSPVVADGHLYLFSGVCDLWAVGACVGGRVVLARVPLEQRAEPGAYRFLGPVDEWSTDPAAAVGILPGARPVGVHVDTLAAMRPDGGVALVETTSIGGTYRVWEADHPAGPWTVNGGDRQLDGCIAPAGRVDFCRALFVQPELSTPDSLGLSHYAVADEHVRVSTTPW